MSKYFCLPSGKAEKGCTLKVNNFLPLGANSFLLEYTPFLKGLDKGLAGVQTRRRKGCLPCQKMAEKHIQFYHMMLLLTQRIMFYHKYDMTTHYITLGY